MLKKLLILPAFLLFLTISSAKIWYVVPGTSIPDPKTAAGLASSGDTIDIAYSAVPYLAYETKWPQHNLLIRGSGTSRPILKAETFSVTQKAIFVIQGNDVTIENIEFTNARVPDKNGAGIRSEGVNLNVRHCTFRTNETGILAGDKPDCKILVEYCEFDSNGNGDGYSHNLYINHIAEFTFRFNYTHDSKIGHLLKSRAHKTYILYNRFDSPKNGNPSREIDLPNGGLAIIIGNIIRQTQNAENSNLVGYGLEGLTNTAPHDIIMINNTLINEKANGSFVHVQNGTNLLKMWNNILAGGGSTINQSPTILDTMSNYYTPNISDASFVDENNQDYHLTTGSWAANHGADPGYYQDYQLLALYEYDEVLGKIDRKFIDKIDIGAFESDISTTIQETKQSHSLNIKGNCITNTGIAGLAMKISAVTGSDIYSGLIGAGEQKCFENLVPGIYIITARTKDRLVASRKFLIN